MDYKNNHDSSQSVESVDWRRVIIFCVLAFAISGSAAIYIALQGGLAALAGTGTLVVLGM